MKLITIEDFTDKELEISKMIFKTDQPCTLKDLTSKELAICRFMEHSKRINGTVIVPPWMLEKAKEIEKKLGITEV